MSQTREIKGLMSALIVPFDEQGKVNEKGLRQVIRHNIDKMKIDGLYVGGSTGENFMLDTATKNRFSKSPKTKPKSKYL